MKSQILLVLLIILGLGLRSQSQVLEFDSYKYDEFFSYTIPMSDKVFISFSNQYHNSATNEHEGFDHQLILDQDGNILLDIVVDSSQCFGNNVGLTAFYLKDSFIFHFGYLVSPDTTQRRVILRKTDDNLSLVSDTILNFLNAYIAISDVIWDSTAFLLSGSLFSPDTSLAFIIRITEDFQIINLFTFPLQMSYWYEMAFYSYHNGDLNLFITSQFLHNDLMLRIDRNTLTIMDTLHIRGFNSPYGTYEYKNCYGSFINDSILLTPIDVFQEVYPLDSLFKLVGWLKWDKDGNILDTLMPFHDTIMADMIGIRKTMLMHQDTIVMAYSHNSVWYITSDTSAKIALIFADLQGNPLKVTYFGGGDRLLVENLIRFDNGNYLVLAQRVNSFISQPNYSFGLVGYLLNRDGDLLQTIDIPKPGSERVLIYPNPTNGITAIQCDISDTDCVLTYKLFDTQGNLVLTEKPVVKNNGFSMNLSRLSAGLYHFIAYQENGKTWKGKIIKN